MKISENGQTRVRKTPLKIYILIMARRVETSEFVIDMIIIKIFYLITDNKFKLLIMIYLMR